MHATLLKKSGFTTQADPAHPLAVSRGQRVIYTTPLKALSNQKLFEMRARFGTERCGLSTGDASIATDAPLMVMTTEILRNIIYRVEEEKESESGRRDTLDDVGLIVLDEVRAEQYLQALHLLVCDASLLQG